MAPNMAVFGTIFGLILKTIMPQKQILGRDSSDKSPSIRAEQKTYYGQNTPYMGLVAVFGKKP